MKHVQYSSMFCLFHCSSANIREAVQPVVFSLVVVVLVVVIVTIVFDACRSLPMMVLV